MGVLASAFDLALLFALGWLGVARRRRREDEDSPRLAHAAHELRTPLAVLHTQIQAAARGDLPADEALRGMQRTLHRAVAASERVLAQSASAGRRAPPCRIDQLLSGVALELSPLIADKDLSFSIEAPPVIIAAHEWQLWQIFGNLLSNAIRHAPAGGSLEIRLSRLARGGCRVVVWNSGSGIDETHRWRLFAPYRSGPGGSGTGLGLALCQQGVQALGGSIDLRNRHGMGGVEAIVCLPARPGEG